MKNSRLFIGLTVIAASLLAPSAAFAVAPVRVPEPGTMAIIGAGVAVMAAHAWWRNRK